MPIILTPEDAAIMANNVRLFGTIASYFKADRSDASVMKGAQVMRYWSGYDDMSGCTVDLRLDHLQRF